MYGMHECECVYVWCVWDAWMWVCMCRVWDVRIWVCVMNVGCMSVSACGAWVCVGSVWMRMCGGWWMDVCVCVQRGTSSVFIPLHFILFRKAGSMNQKFSFLASLAVWQSPRIHFFSTPKCWGHRHMQPHPAFLPGCQVFRFGPHVCTNRCSYPAPTCLLMGFQSHSFT